MTLNVSALDKDYAKVITEADAKMNELNALACGVGLGKNALKTCDFSVDSEYRSVRNESGEYRQEFVGYRCRHSLKVEFGFDTTLLGNVLSAFAASNAKPELGVEFALADESSFVRLALAAAVDDAKMRARAIAEAAGVKLDGITSVENCNRGNDFRSNTNVNFESARRRAFRKVRFCRARKRRNHGNGCRDVRSKVIGGGIKVREVA